MKIVATLKHAVQIGPEDWRMDSISRVFDMSRPIADILSWAESEGIRSPTINDVMLSIYTGDSI